MIALLISSLLQPCLPIPPLYSALESHELLVVLSTAHCFSGLSMCVFFLFCSPIQISPSPDPQSIFMSSKTQFRLDGPCKCEYLTIFIDLSTSIEMVDQFASFLLSLLCLHHQGQIISDAWCLTFDTYMHATLKKILKRH